MIIGILKSAQNFPVYNTGLIFPNKISYTMK